MKPFCSNPAYAYSRDIPCWARKGASTATYLFKSPPPLSNQTCPRPTPPHETHQPPPRHVPPTHLHPLLHPTSPILHPLYQRRHRPRLIPRLKLRPHLHPGSLWLRNSRRARPCRNSRRNLHHHHIDRGIRRHRRGMEASEE